MLTESYYIQRERRRRVHRVALALAVAILCCGISQSHAYFERLVTSARTVSLGGAFVSIADDPTAVFVNPAGLALTSRTGFLATYQKPFGVTGLDESYACAAIPLKKVGVMGASWHYLGLKDAMAENLISLAFARHLVATTQDASLSAGINVDFMRASADANGESDYLVTGGLGVLLRPFPSIGMGYAVRNLVEGDIHLLEGGPGTPVRRQQAWGLSVEWLARVTLALERRQNAVGDWKNHAGVEIVTHPNLVLRGGVDGRSAAGGFGVLWRDVHVDVAVASHADLGATYVFSIGWLPKVKNPYAQSP